MDYGPFPPGVITTDILIDGTTFLLPEIGATFNPFDLTIERGEDVLARIVSATPSAPDHQGICVIVGAGYVSDITVEQPDDATTTVTHQGCFQLLCLQGLYLPTAATGALTTTGRVKILAALHGPTEPNTPRRSVEGVVSGRLIAATTVTVSMGTFKVDVEKVMTTPQVWDDFPRYSKGQTIIGGPGDRDTCYELIYGRIGDSGCQRKVMNWPPPGAPPPTKRVIHHYPSNWRVLLSSTKSAAVFSKCLPPGNIHPLLATRRFLYYPSGDPRTFHRP